MPELKLSVSEVNRVCVEIKNLSEFDFQDYAFSFKMRRIILFMANQKIPDIENLIYRFNQSVNFVSDFLRFFFIPQTELFRDTELWNYLSVKIFPKLVLKKDVTIHIPYCIGGEEIYSLMFFLGLFKSTAVTILISHPLSENEGNIKNRTFNQTDLKKCAKNIELLNSVLNPEDIFIGQTNQLKINHYFRGKIKFVKEAVTKQHYVSEFDLVLFRNRLIYYNEDLQNIVLQKISASIKKGGLLVLGEKETLGQLSGKFKKPVPNLSVYKKRIF